jgi:hypothetical protein
MLSDCFMWLSYLVYSPAIKMEVKRSSETSVDIEVTAAC